MMPKQPDVDLENMNLKETIREAHETIVSLRLLVKEAKPLIAALAEDQIANAISEQTRVALDGYYATIDAAVSAATEAVFDRFEIVANLLLGKGTPTDLEALAVRTAKLREVIGGQDG